MKNVGWILTAERKPKNERRVLISHDGEVDIGYRDRKQWVEKKEYEWYIEGTDWTFEDSEVDAWMPLPKPYEVY